MNSLHDVAAQRKLIDGLRRVLRQTHGEVAVHETHLSWVLVAGEVAYKLKKAVHFDFVDFSTPERRCHFCQEEIRLNRRMAPRLYLGVDVVCGTLDQPAIVETAYGDCDSGGTVLDYAVRMKSFTQDCLWNERLQRGELLPAEVDALAELLGRFHQETTIARADSAWGSAEGIAAVAHDNISTIKALAPEGGRRLAAAVSAWTDSELRRLEPVFAARKQAGFARDCHGDLHTGNILTRDGKVEVFDCIDFNESLRWIDVVSDLAFACMDLQYRGRPDLAARLLNRYLEITGDYDGVQLLRFHVGQRAAVRCKVALLLATQLRTPANTTTSNTATQDGEQRLAQALADARGYLEFCEAQSRPQTGWLLITVGFSGSGKSTFSQRLVEIAGVVRLRSDLERKRLAGMAPAARDGAASGLYADGMTGMTYRRLETLARGLLECGMTVVVDATFLDPERRKPFMTLAGVMQVPFTILEFQASDKTLRQRVTARAKEGLDASDADFDILERQFEHYLPLSSVERAHAVNIDAESAFDDAAVQRACDQIGLPTWPCARQSSA